MLLAGKESKVAGRVSNWEIEYLWKIKHIRIRLDLHGFLISIFLKTRNPRKLKINVNFRKKSWVYHLLPADAKNLKNGIFYWNRERSNFIKNAGFVCYIRRGFTHEAGEM